MANKKTKLTLSGIAKKSIQNIELAKTQSKNSVVIEKKTSRFVGTRVHFKDQLIKVINFTKKIFYGNKI